jgi:hypothetical protein
MVEVPWDKKQLDATLFEYGMDDVIEIKVAIILRPLMLIDSRSMLAEFDSYKIHAGYCHILLGFNREIAFVTQDGLKDEDCRFRCQYLMRVLDAFAQELRDRKVENPAYFRSQVLNPILQRRFWGAGDNDPRGLKFAFEWTPLEATQWYLERDPLDPMHCTKVLHSLLYIPEVRLSLRLYALKCVDRDYKKAGFNTQWMMRHRDEIPLDEIDDSRLYDFEIQVVEQENLGHLYHTLMGDLVSGLVCLQKTGNLRSQEIPNIRSTNESLAAGKREATPLLTAERNGCLAEKREAASA